ncbi:actin depolymerizing protein [Clavulina sp. PMI_390]|nr:actin depolymerizing protein [Clavulina sp. PMI_390]
MSANSGLSVSSSVTQAYADAAKNNTRFILISIQGETIDLDQVVPAQSDTLEEDITSLPDLLDEKVPSYVLGKLDAVDDLSGSWLFISYVPEGASVRHKMLYASSRSALTRSIGESKLKDTLFATSKADLTPEAYSAHTRSSAAPKPMSAREKEMEEVRAAERGSNMASSTARMTSHMLGGATAGVGFAWSEELESAVGSLTQEGSAENLVIVAIEQADEKLVLVEQKNITIDQLTTSLPTTEASYSFFAWDHTVNGTEKRDIIFIYACPSSSPVKSRMLYSSSANTLVQHARTNFNITVSKRVEVSDPSDIDVPWLKRELEPTASTSTPGSAAGSGASTPVIGDEKKPFARPKGPTRRPR